MSTNDFLPFCSTDTGTNVEEQAAYLADANRPIGNQPGVASSKFNNKALRQANAVTSQVAQYVCNTTGANINDDGNGAKLLAQITSTFMAFAPKITTITSSTTFYNTYYFFIDAGNATSGATYTNNSQTFTVLTTISAGVLLSTTGTGAPLVSGTLTKATGTGDATITFEAVRAPISMDIDIFGGGGGGGGGGTSGQGPGGNGGNSTFGSTLLVANGGTGGAGASSGGAGGTASIGSGPVGQPFSGAYGGSAGYNSTSTSSIPGGTGGQTPLGGAGPGGYVNVAGLGAVPNTGSGGGGSATKDGTSSCYGGGGGGAGGYAKGSIDNPVSSYAIVIGAAGLAGTAGTNGFGGGLGATGFAFIRENF